MKRTILYLAAAAVIALGFTSCNKDEKTEEGMQFRATMENNDAKTALVGTHVNWVEGDEVMIFGTHQNGLYRATPDADDARSATLNQVGQQVISNGGIFTAVYPASAAVNATTVTLPAQQQSVDGSLANTFPMYAQSYDENLQFKNLCGVLKIHLQQEGATVSRISVTATTEINGNFSVDNSGEAPAISYVEGGNFTTTLICSEAQDITNGKDFYIYMPEGNYSGLKIMIMNAGYGVEKNAPANATIAIERSKYSTLSFANVNMPIPPDNGVWGLYSVSDNQQVWIATGNLQFRNEGTFVGADDVTHTGTWRIAEHQWDFCGYGTGNYKGNVTDGNNGNSSKWIDQFAWGATCYNGNNPLPRVENVANYPTMPTTIANTNYDWGVYCIGDGWRTLTPAEWQYMVNNGHNRNNPSSKFGHATVNGTHGLILLPDIWNGPAITPHSNNSTYEDNVFTADEWAEFEALGAAFLPVTNYCNASSSRLGNPVYGDGGWYWGATGTTSNSQGFVVYTQHFDGSGTAFGNANMRRPNSLLSVRLCKNYVPASANE